MQYTTVRGFHCNIGGRRSIKVYLWISDYPGPNFLAPTSCILNVRAYRFKKICDLYVFYLSSKKPFSAKKCEMSSFPCYNANFLFFCEISRIFIRRLKSWNFHQHNTCGFAACIIAYQTRSYRVRPDATKIITKVIKSDQMLPNRQIEKQPLNLILLSLINIIRPKD